MVVWWQLSALVSHVRTKLKETKGKCLRTAKTEKGVDVTELMLCVMDALHAALAQHKKHLQAWHCHSTSVHAAAILAIVIASPLRQRHLAAHRSMAYTDQHHTIEHARWPRFACAW